MNLSKNLSFNHPEIGTLDNVGIAQLAAFYQMPKSIENWNRNYLLVLISLIT